MGKGTTADPILLGDKKLPPAAEKLVAMLRQEIASLHAQLAPQKLQMLWPGSFRKPADAFNAVIELPGLYPIKNRVRKKLRLHREHGFMLQTHNFNAHADTPILLTVFSPVLISFCGPEAMLSTKGPLTPDEIGVIDPECDTGYDINSSLGDLNVPRASMITFLMSLREHWPEHAWQSPATPMLPENLAIAAYAMARITLRSSVLADAEARQKQFARYATTTQGLLTDYILSTDDQVQPDEEGAAQIQSYMAMQYIFAKYADANFKALDGALQFTAADPNPTTSMARFFAADLINFSTRYPLAAIQSWHQRFFEYFFPLSEHASGDAGFDTNLPRGMTGMVVSPSTLKYLRDFLTKDAKGSKDDANTPDLIRAAVQRVLQKITPEDLEPQAWGEKIMTAIHTHGLAKVVFERVGLDRAQ